MSRRDSSDRQAFREYVHESIDEGRSPSFEALTNDQGGWNDWSMGWRDQEGQVHEFGRPGFHSNEGHEPGWFDTDFDAGHTTSSAANRDAYAIEDRSSNRSDGALYESAGIVLEKPAVEIENLSVNREFAELMEDRGLLQEGIIDQAPAIEGWTRDDGIVGRNDDDSQTETFQADLDPDPYADYVVPAEDFTQSNETDSAADLVPDPFEVSNMNAAEDTNGTTNDDSSLDNVDLDPDSHAWETESSANEPDEFSESSVDVDPDSAASANCNANEDYGLPESCSSSESDTSATSSAESDSSAEGSGSDCDASADGADGGD